MHQVLRLHRYLGGRIGYLVQLGHRKLHNRPLLICLTFLMIVMLWISSHLSGNQPIPLMVCPSLIFLDVPLLKRQNAAARYRWYGFLVTRHLSRIFY